MDPTSGVDKRRLIGPATEGRCKTLSVAGDSAREWVVGHMAVIQWLQLGLSAVLVLLLLVHATRWGADNLSGGLLAIAALAGLSSIAAALVARALAADRRKELERIEVYLRDFNDPGQATASFGSLPPFPVGLSVSEAGVGWNNLLAIVEEARRESKVEKACQSMVKRVSDYDTQRLQSVLDSLPDGIVVADAEGAIVLTNRACEGELGRDMSNMVGRSVLEVFADRVAVESLREMLDPRTLRSEVAFEVELIQASDADVRGNGGQDQRGGDEKSPPVSDEASPPDNDGLSAPATTLWVRCYRISSSREKSDIVLAMRDISQHKIAEASKEAFIAHVGHEFRSPLTNIRAYAETLLSDMVLDAATQKEAFNVINEETARLIVMVNDVLDLSRMETGSMTLTRDNVVLDRLIQQGVNDLQAMASSKQITLQTNYHAKMPNIYADRDKIAIVINNVLSNAIKYTPDGGTVFVETNVDDNVIYIKITDTGIGIADDDIKCIFDKFYRVDRKETAQITGTGLGLAITKEIVTLHGGNISVSSELNKGTEVIIKLPLTVKGPAVGLSSEVRQ